MSGINDFLYIVHLETLIPMIVAGIVMGFTLFRFFKPDIKDIYMMTVVPLVFGIIGVIVRFLEGEQWERFSGVMFLYFVFLFTALLTHKVWVKIKRAPYFTE